MSEECTHDCSTCGKNCSERKEKIDFSAKLNQWSSVKKVIAVASGKGGVGKSLVASLLASAAAKRGLRTAVLDADITGPSIPKAFGLSGGTMACEQGILPCVSAGGVRVMSLNLLVDNPSDPVVWRGPVIAGTVKQFWTDVYWEDIDIMFVDMPPGTGDVPLTVFQSLPVDGIVVVASPQELVGMIVEKSVRMAGMMEKKVLGLVENMSYFTCPDCGKKLEVFGPSRVDELAKQHGIPVACRLPIDPPYAAAVDRGAVESINCPELKPLIDSLTDTL
ncbi:MAG: Mrp/NBP35 family ATP-binding protein [Kiritimatiellae bacterium]|nr:Mrp/NBP35 family ATP-binding protein [Kiritimatiellia bacterium]